MNNPLKKLKTISLFILCLLSFNAYSECRGNCFNGYGTQTFSDGETYTGDWVNGKFIK